MLLSSILVTGLSLRATSDLPDEATQGTLDPAEAEALKVALETRQEESIPKMLHKAEQLKLQALAEEQRKKEETELQSLTEQIRNYLGKNIDNVGLAYYDLNSGNTLSINGDKIFTAASTVKVPLAMLVYDQIAQGTLKENEALPYNEEFYEGGTGILQNQDLSKPIPLPTLVEYAIRYSDNIATNMLIGKLGYENFKRGVDQMSGIVTSHEGNYITANGALNILKRLYTESLTNTYYQKIISWMKTTIFHDKMDRDIDQRLVAHKIGLYGSYVSDIGIVYTPDPYVLAIYTHGLDDPNTVIANVSKIIFNHEKNG